MNFAAFEAMYKLLWECIYNICTILGIEISNPYEA